LDSERAIVVIPLERDVLVNFHFGASLNLCFGVTVVIARDYSHQHNVARSRKFAYMMTSFIPRSAFPPLTSLPRSYYLGHHAAGLSKMRTLLRQIDLIIECRDQRIPLTSRNPMFEESLAGRERMIVYTKNDLGNTGSREDLQVRTQI
jgi:hypothetical protein